MSWYNRKTNANRGKLSRVVGGMLVIGFIVSLSGILAIVSNGDVTSTPEYKAKQAAKKKNVA